MANLFRRRFLQMISVKPRRDASDTGCVCCLCCLFLDLHPRRECMTNRSNEPAGKSGYPSSMEPHLSAQQATQEIKAHADEDIDALIGVLDMLRPVSRYRMTALVEMLIKETITDDAEATAKAMRAQGWETELSPDENLHELAARLTSYLSREPGVHLLNQFTHSIAKTTGRMY